MAKKNPLNAGLEKRKGKKGTDTDKSKTAANGRSDRVLVAGHFAKEVQRALRIIAAEEETTVQALLAEALNMLFAKRHRPEIAEASNAAPVVEAEPVEEEVPA